MVDHRDHHPENNVLVDAWTAAGCATADPARATTTLARARAFLDDQPELLLYDGTLAARSVELAGELVACAHPTSRDALAEARTRLERIASANESGSGASLLVSLAQAQLSRLPASEAYLVAEDGSWFESPDGARVSFEERPSMRGVLAALATADAEGRRVSRQALFEAGWPGEQILDSAASSRVRVALSQIRKAGLDIIERGEGGWQLAPDAALLVVPANAD